MKKVLFLSILSLFVVVMPAMAFGSSFKTGNNYYLNSGETVSDNLYVAAGDINIAGAVEGDLFTAGGNVFVSGPVSADLAAAGGTLIKLARQYRVISIVLTRGEAGTFGTPKIRIQEAKDAAVFAGADIQFLDFKDNHIEDNTASAKKLAQVIRTYQPRIVMAPYHTNDFSHKDGAAHPDHTALGRLARKACRLAKFKNIELKGKEHQVQTLIYYMIPKYVKPSFIIDVSDVEKDMQKLWQCHKSQTQLRKGRLLELLLWFREFHGRLNGMKYAEAFVVEEPLKLNTESMFHI